MQVLIADDNEVRARELCAAAKHVWPDAHIETISSGGEALQRLKSEPPDVLIAGLLLAGINGLDLARYASTRKVPTVIVNPHGRALLPSAADMSSIESFLRDLFMPRLAQAI